MSDIERKEVEVPKLGNLSVPSDFNLEKADGAKYESLDEFVQAHKKVSFWKKLKLTWQGKTDVGRIGGTILDIAELFAPTWAVKTRSIIQSQTQPEPKPNTTMSWILNRLQEKSTWRGVTAALTALGVALSPDQTAAIVTLGVAVAGAFEVFFKEPQSKDAK